MTLSVVVYVKPGCTLCEPVLRTVERVQEDVPFTLSKVDISGDPALMERYGQEVPVVTIDGRKAFKGRIDEAAFRKRLKKARELAHAHAPEPAELEEEVEVLPPRPIAAALIALAVGVAGYFVFQGVVEARGGEGRLAGQLLKVEQRSDQPVRFELETLDGKKISLDDYRDKTVFLNFWATWCPPCIEEMPSMIRLGQRLKDDPRFVMLAVSADDGWPVVRQFWGEREPPPFTVALDATGKIAKEYGTTMFPETYVVKNGKIIGFIEGPRDWDKWYADVYLRNVAAQPR